MNSAVALQAIVNILSTTKDPLVSLIGQTMASALWMKIKILFVLAFNIMEVNRVKMI